MRFKDRRDAGQQLGALLQRRLSATNPKDIVVISLLRGGILIGHEVAKALHAVHIPLIVSKIHAPQSEELAIGAISYDVTYLDRSIIDYLGGIPRPLLRHQIQEAQLKFDDYADRFVLQNPQYKKTVRGKTVIIVDDGVATGASIKTAALYISTLNPMSIVIASPIVSGALEVSHISVVSLVPNAVAGAISEFYDSFDPVEDDEILLLLKSS